MFSIFLSNQKCGLEHVVNKLMSFFIIIIIIIIIISFAKTNKQKERWQGHRNSCGQLQRDSHTNCRGNEYRTSSILHGTP